MALPIPTSWRDALNEFHQGDPWLYLWTIILGKTQASTPRLSIVNHPEEVVVGGRTFHPFSSQHSDIVFGSDGQLPQLQLALDNSTKFLGSYIEANDSFLGNPCTLWIVNKGDLTEYLELEFTIVSVTVTPRVVSLMLELDNFHERHVPLDAFSVSVCGHIYGGPRCGYILNQFAAHATCGKTYTDCVARGDDMFARGLGRPQPERFGAFPGIPVQ